MTKLSISSGRPNSRERILDAAAALAKEVGPANLSLEGVAERAGLSKGGLLYNFPSKSDLLTALVDRFVAQRREALDSAEASNPNSANSTARACLDLFRDELRADCSPPSGILAAIAEDPRFIDPVRRFCADIVERLRRDSADPELALIAYLTVEGLRLSRLLGTDPLKPEERDAVLKRLAALLG